MADITPAASPVELELIQIGNAIFARDSRFGARPPSDKEKITAAIELIKQRICPYKTRINILLDRLSAEMAVLVIDIIVSTAIGIHAPVVKISELIVLSGLERFCDDPKSTIKEID